jgi:hypothetical protein
MHEVLYENQYQHCGLQHGGHAISLPMRAIKRVIPSRNAPNAAPMLEFHFINRDFPKAMKCIQIIRFIVS